MQRSTWGSLPLALEDGQDGSREHEVGRASALALVELSNLAEVSETAPQVSQTAPPQTDAAPSFHL